MIYSFIEEKPKNDYKEYPIYALYKKIKNNDKWSQLTNTEKEKFSELSFGYLYKTGYYRIRGWHFDFTPFMKRYLVHLKYQGWTEFYALSKMQIRETMISPSDILEIIEA